jgi:hypothetical protein
LACSMTFSSAFSSPFALIFLRYRCSALLLEI